MRMLAQSFRSCRFAVELPQGHLDKCVTCADAAARFKMRIFARPVGPEKCETVWVVMPDETLVTPVRAVHSGGSGGDWMKGRRGEREDINGLSSCGSITASAAAHP